MRIRKVTLTEASKKILSKLDKSIFPYDDPIPMRGKEFWVAWEGISPVGYACISRKGETCRLHRVGVMPSARGNGLQRRLMAACERSARAAGAKYVLAYTHNQNTASMINLLKSGYIPYLQNKARRRQWIHWRHTLRFW